MTTVQSTTSPPTRAEQFIQELIMEVISQLRGMWRFRWRAAIIVWVICIVCWIGVFMMPNVYSASARIYVDTENAIQPLLRGIATSSDLLSEVTVVTREMLSRPNLAEVARSTDLDLRANSDADLEALLSSLRDRISVTGSRENIFTISFQDPDREKAVAVVDSLVNTFVEKSLGGNRTESSQAQSFLQSQIAEYEKRLTDSEDRLADFKRRNVSVLPGQGGDYFSRLQGGRSALTGTESRLRLAEERRAELLRQIEGEEPTFGIMPQAAENSGDGQVSAKIRELEMQVGELRLRYTDKHPRIGQLLDTIESLKVQESNSRADDVSRNGGIPQPLTNNRLDMNPVYQNMRIQLTNTEVEIAALRTEREQQRKEIDELQRMIDTIPQVEAELGRLNRDYDVVKAKYEQLLQQLESANIGEDVEASIDEVQFRIIDPPFAAQNPVGPKRQLMLSASLVFALCAGAGITFLLNLLRPVFYTGRAVTAITHLPVLGGVTMLLSSEELMEKRRQKIRFVASMGLLVGVFVIVSVFSTRWSSVLREASKAVSL